MFDFLIEKGILLDEFYDKLKAICNKMLTLWSQSVLLSWINVYIRLKPSLEAFTALVNEMS